MAVKKLGFGLMRLPLLNPEEPGSVDIELLKQMVDIFLQKGFTYFDTAWMYCGGKSEEAIGEALVSRYPRESFTLTDKLPSYMLKSEADREMVFSEQLRRTGAGYFDYYWLHNVNGDSLQEFDQFKCWDFLKEKKAQGLVKHIGFSYHDRADLLEKILSVHPEVEYVQLQLNYLDWESLGVQSRACYEVCVKYKKPVIVMEPVKGGTLAKVPKELEDLFKEREPEKSVPSWAVRFAASHENVCMVLSGMSNMQQLLDNTAYMENFVPLSEEEKEFMKTAAEILRKDIAIACTGCSYCTVKCPMKIPIPSCFSLYNAEMMTPVERRPVHGGYYSRLTKHQGKASSCIRCGRCEALCPQHLPIRKYLEDVAKEFE